MRVRVRPRARRCLWTLRASCTATGPSTAASATTGTGSTWTRHRWASPSSGAPPPALSDSIRSYFCFPGPEPAAIPSRVVQPGPLPHRRQPGGCDQHHRAANQNSSVPSSSLLSLCLSFKGGGQQQAPATGQPLVSEDDRYGSVYIQGRGNVVTYMFQVGVHHRPTRFWFPSV